MSLSELSIRRPVFVLMVLGALAVLGLISYSRIPVDLFPNVQFPFVSIVTLYPGAGPQEVEELITKPVEEEVGSLPNVRQVFSISQEGASIVGIEFRLGTDINANILDVRQRVDLVKTRFPRDAEDPTVSRFDFTAQPILILGVGGAVDPFQLRRIADDLIKPRLERVPGVAAVNVSGGRTREIRVEVDEDRLRALGLRTLDIEDALRRENLNLPSGRLRQSEQETLVRVVGQFTSSDEVAAIPITYRNGRAIRLGDVATVKDTFKEPTRFTRLNGQPSIGISVQKQADANTVAVAEGIHAALEDLKKLLPSGVVIEVAFDSSQFIKDSVADVQGNLILGSILATVVVFLFLHNVRSTVIIGLALPAAIVATYIPMYFFGFSLNVLSLLGLAIAIGLMIDNAIVVNENINRHLELGEPPIEAARLGAKEIELAVMASNLANVAVFLPIAFMGGLVGQFFRQFGLTVAFSNLFSILVGFTLTPMLSARWLRRPSGDQQGRVARIAARWDAVFERLSYRYAGALRWALQHRAVVLLIAILLFVSSLGLAASPWIGKEFMPMGDYGEFQVNITMPGGSSLIQTDAITRRMEGLLRQTPEVRTFFTQVGTGGDAFISSESAQQAQIFVRLVDRDQRERSVDKVMEDLRRKVADIPAAKIKIGAQGVAGGTAPVQVEITGPDLEVLNRLASEVKQIVASVPGTTSVDTNLEAGKTEIQVIPDRQILASLGLSTAEVGAQLRTAIEGSAVTRYRVRGSEFDITVRAEESDRNQMTKLEELHVGMAHGTPIRLGQVADLRITRGPASIERRDRQRLALVTAGLAGRPLGAVVSEVQKQIQDLDIPPGYQVKFGGEAEFQREAFGDMFFALGLGTLLVYMTIAAQMESISQPLVILFSVPLASVGVFLMLLLTRTTVSIMSLLGIVMLAGIVVNNAILLVEFTNQLRGRGLSRMEAILQAGRTRLRPILMTAMVSIMGGLPVALGIGTSGAEWRRPLGIAVLGGLTTSTFLTLIVIPVVYTLVDDLVFRFRRAEAPAPSEAKVQPVSGGGDRPENTP